MGSGAPVVLRTMSARARASSRSVPRHRAAAAPLGHRFGLLRAAVGHQDSLGPQFPQVLQRQLAHLAGADHQDGLVVEVREDLRGRNRRPRWRPTPCPGRCRSRCGPAWRRGRACWNRCVAAAGPTTCLVLSGPPRRPADLPGDLALADDQAVEAGDDAEQVADRVGVAMLVQVGPNRVRRQSVELGKEFGDQAGIRGDGRTRRAR